MAFSWQILAAVYVVNFLAMGIMFALQQLDKKLPPRGSIIPGTRQKFLYIQDWNTMLWGDTIAVPLVLSTFVHLAMNDLVAQWQWAFLVLFSNILSVFFIGRVCWNNDHKPDYGTYDNHQSWAGVIHATYFGICVAVSGITFGNVVLAIINEKISVEVLGAGLLGATIYAVSWICDYVAGNFKPLKKLEQEETK